MPSFRAEPLGNSKLCFAFPNGGVEKSPSVMRLIRHHLGTSRLPDYAAQPRGISRLRNKALKLGLQGFVASLEMTALTRRYPFST
jgi:hypothetical protein